eukprot:COSAG01_NODE_38232_length_492_cov_0.910941_1_plen_123_part_00
MQCAWLHLVVVGSGDLHRERLPRSDLDGLGTARQLFTGLVSAAQHMDGDAVASKFNRLACVGRSLLSRGGIDNAALEFKLTAEQRILAAEDYQGTALEHVHIHAYMSDGRCPQTQWCRFTEC